MNVQFFRVFFWHVVRYTRRHRLLAGLNILSVALGVSVYLAIQIANHSANQSFAASIDLVAGKANLEVRAPPRSPSAGRKPRMRWTSTWTAGSATRTGWRSRTSSRSSTG